MFDVAAQEMTEELVQQALDQQPSIDSANGDQQGENSLEVELSSRNGGTNEEDDIDG